jgi:Sec-independent protein secretion pathway component TatC
VIAPSNNFAFLFIVAGLLLVSLLFLTASPLDITNLILGTIPLVLLFCFGFSIWKAKSRPGAENKDREAREDGD